MFTSKKIIILPLLLFVLPLYQRKLALFSFIWICLLFWSLIIISSSEEKLLLVLFIFIKMSSHKKTWKSKERVGAEKVQLMFMLQPSREQKFKQRKKLEGEVYQDRATWHSVPPEYSQQQPWRRAKVGSTQNKICRKLKFSNKEH